ncbi:MAG: peptidoglycan-binding protein, partial [Treponema sp.]|nr:peptidoglycan-binding protein [Treponema sp.]
RRFEDARELLVSGFIPSSPDFTDAIMDKIYAEEQGEEVFDIPGGVSTRGWVIAGIIILVSLATSFFGGDFISIAASQGSSFLLPLGILIGIIVSAYGALFIGSHLKELSERFRLR